MAQTLSVEIHTVIVSQCRLNKGANGAISVGYKTAWFSLLKRYAKIKILLWVKSFQSNLFPPVLTTCFSSIDSFLS